jgi:hypothetical protein
MDAERLEQELELLRSVYPDLEHREVGGEHWVRIPAYAIANGWFAGGGPVDMVEIVFTIPTQPGQAPYAFRPRPVITLAGGAVPSNYAAPVSTPWGDDFAQFSWSPLDGWVPKVDIRAGANMLNFVRSFAERLKDLS